MPKLSIKHNVETATLIFRVEKIHKYTLNIAKKRASIKAGHQKYVNADAILGKSINKNIAIKRYNLLSIRTIFRNTTIVNEIKIAETTPPTQGKSYGEDNTDNAIPENHLPKSLPPNIPIFIPTMSSALG